VSIEISRGAFEELEQNFDDVRDDYSGRGMYGERCLAIVTDDSAWTLRGEIEEIRDTCKQFDQHDEADDLTLLLSKIPREDSMGLSSVYYWPSITIAED
jgi:hypothetical protein